MLNIKNCRAIEYFRRNIFWLIYGVHYAFSNKDIKDWRLNSQNRIIQSEKNVHMQFEILC